MNTFTVSGKIVDVVARHIFEGTVTVQDGRIAKIAEKPVTSSHYILPGLIDAHVHVESSLCVPSEFARLATPHGTVATISDPHEIANVLGIEGVRYMIENGRKVPFKFYFGAPSCVPATSFETAGAKLSAQEIEVLFREYGLKYLSEMMNYPGVLHQDPEVMAKIEVAKRYGKPVDGHAPGLMGEDALKYIEAGISTDHECFMLEEAQNKLQHGMKILIREGTAAKNFEALHPVIGSHPEKVMFCSDDKHCDELVKSHINALCARAIRLGYDRMDVLRCASYNPVKHYGLDVGLLQVGDPADFIVCDSLEQLMPSEVYIDGTLVAKEGKSLIKSVAVEAINNFSCEKKVADDFQVKGEGDTIRVIQAIDGQLITKSFERKATEIKKEEDILKIAVINRYANKPPAVAFIKGFGLKQGAIASSVAHDSHNIIVVGCDDESMAACANLLIGCKGGLAAFGEGKSMVLPLEVAGLMSVKRGEQVAKEYEAIVSFVKKELGSCLTSPFMTLSFMALLVIPELKLSDQGLFDGGAGFQFVPVLH